MEKEIWRDVLGFEEMYQVSNFGRVKGLKRKVVTPGGFRTVHERIMDQHRHSGNHNPDGKYASLFVSLSKDNKVHPHFVHRIVLEAFIGKRPDGTVCCHRDGNGFNNHIENLRWDTPRANTKDSIRHGTFKLGTIKNENHFKAKYKNYQVIMIRKLATAGVPRHIIEKAFNAKHGSLSRIITNKIWKMD